MGSLVSAADIIPTVTTGVGLYQDIRLQEEENAYQQARYQQQQQQADLAYQQALQQRDWELQRRALEEQYRQQELAQQQARQQQEYQFALQQQQWELEQRAYEERLRDWELNRLALEQQNSYDALVAQQDLGFSQAQQELAQQQAEWQQSSAMAEEERRNDLRRALASQRVSLGARGVDTASGSGQAVLRGLIEESEGEGETRRRTDAIREAGLTQDLANLRQNNLLERTRLAEAQRFQLLTYLG